MRTLLIFRRAFVQQKAAFFVLIVVLALGGIIGSRFWQAETEGLDVYYGWVEGGRLLNGENPYSRVLTGNMRDNAKYATHFPVFYELSALSQWAGLSDYDRWIAFWRSVFLAFDLAVGAALFGILYPRGRLLVATVAAVFWLFNRWTLHVITIVNADFIAVFLLIVSLGVLRRYPRASLLLFSFSLGFKQMAVFLIPLYLVWVWQAVGEHRVRRTLLAALLIASVPALSSLPFLIWDAEGLFKSLLFSATRYPVDHFGVLSLDARLGWEGLPARLPMLALMLAIYVIALRRGIGRYTASLLVMAVFIGYNSVLFLQYMVWIIPLVPLVIYDGWNQAMSAVGHAQARPTGGA
jgi:hypothetical protein